MPTNHGRPLLCAALAAALLLCAALAAPVGATPIKKTLSEWTDTSFSGPVNTSGSSLNGGGYIDTIYVKDISLEQSLSYIWLDLPFDALVPNGDSTFSYSLGALTATEKDHIGTMSVSRSYSATGSVSATRIILYFPEWDIGTLEGAQYIKLNKSLWTRTKHTGVSTDSNMYAGDEVESTHFLTSAGTHGHYTISYVSGELWQNEIYLNTDISPYCLNVTRAIQTSANTYLYSYSTVSVFDAAGDVSYTQSANTDISTLLYPASTNTVVVSSATHNYTLLGSALIETDKFSLSLSQDTASVGDEITATIVPADDAPRYSEIAWTVTDPDGNVDVELYSKSSDDWSTWQHYNKTSFLMENSTESAAHTLSFSPTSAGTWTVSAVVRDQQPPSTGAALASLSASCSVSRKAGDVDVIVSIFDGAKSSPSYLSGVGVTVWDLSRNSSVVYDSTGEYIIGASGTTNGIASFTAPLGDQIRISVEKSGYVTHTETTFVQPTALPRNQMPISITLMPAATPSADWVYLSVTVTTVTNSPIEDASVVVGNHTGITNAQGICKVSIPANTTLSYSISATGYYSTSGYVMPVSENSAITVQLNLVSSVVTTSPIGDATPNPDTRTNAEKSQSALDMLYDNAEAFVALCLLATFLGILKLIAKW